EDGAYQLIGITDTSMLRPQVFALQEGEVSIGLIASEKQAIDATLASLAEEDPRFLPVADRYWNARGGSHTDGGAFVFSVQEYGDQTFLRCTNKFGEPVTSGVAQSAGGPPATETVDLDSLTEDLSERIRAGDAIGGFEAAAQAIPAMEWDDLRELLQDLRTRAVAAGAKGLRALLEITTLLLDRNYPLGGRRRAQLRAILQEELFGFLRSLRGSAGGFAFLGWEDRSRLRAPSSADEILVVDARGFPPEGDEGLDQFVVRAYHMGWKRVVGFDLTGQRFLGCGLGANSQGFRLDLYGSPGDYLASGLDGAEVHVHANGQDQMAQIMKAGKLVVHGDLGQTFMYAAKGGEVYVKGNVAGRPLINAVGKPRVVINGTALDYLAESFMAGDPHKGGGFVVLNGIRVRDDGTIEDLGTPYPGGNLFSLASGGAIFMRDPRHLVGADQLNGGQFDSLSDEDWDLIRPYLEENERLFGIKVKELLTVDGARRPPHTVYRKVKAVALKVLAHTGL
ncbi:MAG TPA: glutamate synthase, partial [Thermoplasmata archaeon]|nr:glutamate synthase [Thermoplasmata archaeon]